MQIIDKAAQFFFSFFFFFSTQHKLRVFVGVCCHLYRRLYVTLSHKNRSELTGWLKSRTLVALNPSIIFDGLVKFSLVAVLVL